MNSTLIMAATLASLMTKDNLVEQLEESISEYKLIKTEDTFGKIVMSSMLVLLKEQSLMNPNGIMGVIEDFEESKAMNSLLNPKEF